MKLPNCSLPSLERLVPEKSKANIRNKEDLFATVDQVRKEELNSRLYHNHEHIKITISHPECNDQNKPMTKTK
jgi:hypothetical protein